MTDDKSMFPKVFSHGETSPELKVYSQLGVLGRVASPAYREVPRANPFRPRGPLGERAGRSSTWRRHHQYVAGRFVIGHNLLPLCPPVVDRKSRPST